MASGPWPALAGIYRRHLLDDCVRFWFSRSVDQQSGGFLHATDEPEKTITVGFGHDTVLGVAAQVLEAVKAGKIRHFFLVGGCDGAELGPN